MVSDEHSDADPVDVIVARMAEDVARTRGLVLRNSARALRNSVWGARFSALSAFLIAAIVGLLIYQENSTERVRSPEDLAAHAVTRRYAAAPHFKRFNIHASAIDAKAPAGQTTLLVVVAGLRLDDSLVDKLHNGFGSFEVFEGGIMGYAKSHAFGSVMYTDCSRRAWAFPLSASTENLVVEHNVWMPEVAKVCK